MRVRAIILGLAVGVAIGVTVIAVNRNPRPEPVRLHPLAEETGRFARVVLHYHPAAAPGVVTVYSQFLRAIEPDVEIVWVAEGATQIEDLKARLGPDWPAGRCSIVLVGKEISTWSRDRCVVLAEQAGGGAGRSTLLAPVRKQSPLAVRVNDQETPYCLARQLPNLFSCRGLNGDFDGGDFLIAAGRVFAHPVIIEKNAPGPGSPFASAGELGRYLAHEIGQELTWLGEGPQDSPDHHVGMFLTIVGRTAFVGDVRLAESIAASQPEVEAALQPAGGLATPQVRTTMAGQLDRVAAQMESLAFDVVRVPLLPSATPKAWMSYNNGLIETRGDRTVFYMPTFGAPPLDDAAADIFRKAGCRVVRIDCAGVWRLGGSLHCLVNVVARR